eukprot:317769_1
MSYGNLVAVLVVIVLMVIAGIYCSRRNILHLGNVSQVQPKRLEDDVSEITASDEPELEVQENNVDNKMKDIAEENKKGHQLSDENNNENDHKKTNKKKKKNKSKIKKDDKETKSNDEALSSDSDEFSMSRMVEEYNKSRTLAKKFSEIIDDISETFKRKSIEIKRKFEKEDIAVVVPMSMPEKLKQINQAKMNNFNDKKKKKKKNEMIKVVVYNKND